MKDETGHMYNNCTFRKENPLQGMSKNAELREKLIISKDEEQIDLKEILDILKLGMRMP